MYLEEEPNEQEVEEPEQPSLFGDDVPTIDEDLAKFKKDMLVRGYLSKAQTKDPKQVKENIAIADQKNLPLDLVEANPEAYKDPTVPDIPNLSATETPRTHNLMSNPRNSYLFGKNADELALIEKESRKLKGMAVGMEGDGDERTWTRALAEEAKGLIVDDFILKGSMMMTDSVIGLLDIVTYDNASAFMEYLGYDSSRAREVLDEGIAGSNFFAGQSEYKKQEMKAVQDAKGFWGTTGAMLANPLATASTIGESGLFTAGIAGLTRTFGASIIASKTLTAKQKMFQLGLISGAVEGGLVTGYMKENLRKQGVDYGVATASAFGAGVTSAGISMLGSRFLPDAEATLASGFKTQKRTFQESLKQIGKTAFKESFLEEMPQEAQEQIWENIATGRDMFEGVGKAGASGLIAGMGQGAVMATYAELTADIADLRETKEVKTYNKSVKEQMSISQVISLAQSVEAKEVAPEEFKAVLEEIDPELSISASKDAVLNMLESGVDLPDFIIEQLQDPDVGDIEMSFADFADTIIADDALLEEFRPHIRVDQDNMTMSEIQEIDFNEVIEKAEKGAEMEKEAKELYKALTEQLYGASKGKLTRVQASQQAMLMPKYLTAKALERNLSVKQIFEDFFDLSITDSEGKIFFQSKKVEQARQDRVTFKEISQAFETDQMRDTKKEILQIQEQIANEELSVDKALELVGNSSVANIIDDELYQNNIGGVEEVEQLQYVLSLLSDTMTEVEIDRKVEEIQQIIDNPEQYQDEEIVTMASEVGYEGNERGEAENWLYAHAKGLDLSYEARMKRAEDLGFAMLVYYHGTMARGLRYIDFTYNDVGFHVGTAEQANNRLQDRSVAMGEASTRIGARTRLGAGANVIPVLVRANNPLVVPRDVGQWDNPAKVLQVLLGSMVALDDTTRSKLQALDGELYSMAEEAGQDPMDIEDWMTREDQLSLLEDIRYILTEAGYDSIRYQNEVENEYGSLAQADPELEAQREERRQQSNAMYERLEAKYSVGEAPPPFEELLDSMEKAKDNDGMVELLNVPLDQAVDKYTQISDDYNSMNSRERILARATDKEVSEFLKSENDWQSIDPYLAEDSESLIILDDTAIRSVHAVFDPEMAETSDILAQPRLEDVQLQGMDERSTSRGFKVEQELDEITLVEERELNGRTVEVEKNAQKVWDRNVKRVNMAEKLMECVNA